MSEYHQRLDAAALKAGKHIRDLKRVSPYLFPQWQSLQIAKDNVKRANAELVRAKAAWDALGDTK